MFFCVGEVIVSYQEIENGVRELESDVPDISDEELQLWHSHNLYSQMIDICGEIENTKRLKHEFEYRKTEENFNKLMLSLDKVHRYCTIVRKDATITDATKLDLSIAEWFLRDYMIGNNSFNISEKYSSELFDQFLFDINYDLLD